MGYKISSLSGPLKELREKLGKGSKNGGFRWKEREIERQATSRSGKRIRKSTGCSYKMQTVYANL